jgi:hypothetical protein
MTRRALDGLVFLVLVVYAERLLLLAKEMEVC